MAAFSTIALVAAAGFSAIGSIQQGQAQAQQSALQGQLLQQQAALQGQVLEQQATTERGQALAQESDFRRQQSRVLAARRAAGGASGVDFSTGSPLMVAEDIAGETELQALRIRSGGEIRATRLEQQAQLGRFGASSESTLLNFQGEQAEQAGFFRAGASLLSGAGKAFG